MSTVIEIPHSAKSIYALEQFYLNNNNIILCYPDEDNAILAYKQLEFFTNNSKQNKSILFFPSFDTIPYDRVSPSNEIMTKRAETLTALAKANSNYIIVTNSINLIKKIPEPEIFKDAELTLSKGKNIDLNLIISFLTNNGFNRVPAAVDNGEFAVRGEIIDMVISNDKGYRIILDWDKIESIKEFDIYSQISTKPVKEFTISPANEVFINNDTIINFKNNFLQKFGVNHIDSPIYNAILSGQKIQGYEQLSSLFYNKNISLIDYLDNYQIIYDPISIKALKEYEQSYKDFYQSRLSANKLNPNNFYYAIPVEDSIFDSDKIINILAEPKNTIINSGSNNIYGKVEHIKYSAKQKNKTEFEILLEIINTHKEKKIIILCHSKSMIERIKKLAKNYEYTTKEINGLSQAVDKILNLSLVALEYSFFNKEYLFISDNEIFGNKINIQGHKSAGRKLKNILDELDNIVEGEYVIHKEYGIGKFEHIQTIYVGDIGHDCMKILYENNDVLYLPVENINQISKYNEPDAKLDKLGAVNWQKRKAKLKKKIKDIAAQLLKTSAKRQLKRTKIIDFDITTYEQFCQDFPYNETEDQLSAIEDIKSDLQSGKLMNRLVCGDVGFGKTEVAMRAAFMVTNDINDDLPQIAIITPTTILARQHFNSFIERFRNTNVKIAQLSRLVNIKQANEIKKDLVEGKINVIIGTHALISDSVKFKNLKMVVIDEEQHFGVTQKEKLKNLKTDIHVLSLSATPIPRTLQMSMVGIKDLSIIATPPIDRLPVKTNLLSFDFVILKDALTRERFRGGVSFFVVPRIKDIDWVCKQLDKMVPDLKYDIAHGQMPASKIDQVMENFYNRKFDILISTTIIESGIDIPIANTIIIHKADMLGLSQLYQLRGRVGRGKVRGYAYLTLPPNKISNKLSMQRLEILQNIDSLGAGFTIASHDMDLRGFGNLVGDEQSGHIREVGAELYHQMLEDAINEIKSNNTEKITDFTPVINLNIAVLIPFNYIEGSALRLAIYRRTADLRNDQEVEKFRDEMIDRFGIIPQEFENLLHVVKIKNICYKLKINSLDSGPNGFVIKFNENFDVSNMVMGFIKKYPKNAKIKPDNKLIYIKKLNNDNLIEDTKDLLDKISSYDA